MMMNKTIYLIFATIFVVMIGLLVFKNTGDREVRIHSDQEIAPVKKQFLAFHVYEPGTQPFPVFAFDDPDEKRIGIGYFKGSYILLNIWATWCAPCIAELPSLEVLAKEMGGAQFKVIALSVDRAKSIKDLAAFLEPKGIGDFARYYDTEQQMIRRYPVEAMPTTLLIDPNGDILYEMVGPAEWQDPEIVAFLKAQIETKSP